MLGGVLPRFRRWPIAAVLLLACQFSVAQESESAWPVERYADHDYVSFAALPEVAERLDFDRIDYPLLQAAVFYATNRQRVANSRQPFAHSEALERAAGEHSQAMTARRFFSHHSPVPGRRTMQARLALVGVRDTYTGENIAQSFAVEYVAGTRIRSDAVLPHHTYLGAARAVVDQWMGSPGHRANILRSRFTHLGVGASFLPGSFPTFNMTQNFAALAE